MVAPTWPIPTVYMSPSLFSVLHRFHGNFQGEEGAVVVGGTESGHSR